MKSLLKISMAFSILAALASSSHALIQVAAVSKEQAKKLGIEVESQSAGPNHLRVVIDFKRMDALKKFDPDKYGRVELRLRDSDATVPRGTRTLFVAPLQLKQPEPGRVSVAFTARRDQVARMSVVIHLMEGLSMVAFNLELEEFVRPEQVDQPVAARSKKPAPAGTGIPAAADVKAN